MVSYGFIGVEGTGHAFCRHRGWHLHFVGGRTSGFQGGEFEDCPLFIFQSLWLPQVAEMPIAEQTNAAETLAGRDDASEIGKAPWMKGS